MINSQKNAQKFYLVMASPCSTSFSTSSRVIGGFAEMQAFASDSQELIYR